MHKLLLALHLLFAIFAIGPLVHAATTASRDLRKPDAAALARTSRMLRVYSYASVLVVILGFALVQAKYHVEFSDAWVWISVVLWLLAVAVVLGVLVPALDKAGGLITEGGAPGSLVGRVAACGGVVGVIFAVIVFLMVYRPG